MIVTSKPRFETVFKSIDNWNITEAEKARARKYIEDYRNGKVTNEITERPDKNLELILEFLKPALLFLKDITEIDSKKTEALFIAIKKDSIKNNHGKPYVTSTKARILKATSKYMEYFNISQEIIKPIKMRIKVEKKSKDVLSQDEIENDLCKSVTATWQYFTHQVLFYGGLRASEFLGLEERDIILPNKNSNYVKIKIRRENTKNDNSERTVTLYGANCASAVKTYLEERKKEGMKRGDLVSNHSYGAIKSWMVRLSEKKKRPIHFHLYRHSAATHLYNEIFFNNYKAFCDFFGWSYSSPTPAIYARRGGSNKLDEEISTKTIEEYKKDIEIIEARKSLEIEELKKQNESVKLEVQDLRELIEAVAKLSKAKKWSPELVGKTVDGVRYG